MPCVDRGCLTTLSFRGLFKRIRCHVACCQGVVTVIEAPDGPQEENDMEDDETGSTHSTQNVSQPRSSRWFSWCHALGRCRTRRRRETVYHQLAYTLHKPARRRFKRNRVIVNGKDKQWEADLVDVQVQCL